MAISLLPYGGKFSMVQNSAEMPPNPSEETFADCRHGQEIGLSNKRIQHC